MDESRLFDSLCLAVRQAGAVAKRLQIGIQNEGKDLDLVVEGESEHVRAMRTAKTAIDEVVQEILLLAIAEYVDPRIVSIDAEEETPSLTFFSNENTENSIVIDPIDGTLEYLEGEDSYSVCVALIRNDEIRFSLVYYPMRDIVYGTREGKSLVYPKFSSRGTSAASEIIMCKDAQRILYKTRRVPEEFEKRFTGAGFEVRLIDGYSDGLLKVLNGEAAGFIGCNPNIRDVLIGPVIGSAPGGFMCDWNGAVLRWPKRGRLPEGFFGNSAFESELRALLR